ncbi:hypothetical protein AURDEDRAFT_114015, partial [Auricularia subglabra TFB-10046 SS5]
MHTDSNDSTSVRKPRVRTCIRRVWRATCGSTATGLAPQSRLLVVRSSWFSVHVQLAPADGARAPARALARDNQHGYRSIPRKRVPSSRTGDTQPNGHLASRCVCD